MLIWIFFRKFEEIAEEREVNGMDMLKNLYKS
jgi:hypothetical protein